MRRHRPDDGAAAVEFALILPLLLALVFGVVEFGRAYTAKVTLTQAAREGVRAWSLTGNASTTEDVVRTAATGLESSRIVISRTPCTAGSPTRVTAEYELELLTPIGPMVALAAGASGGSSIGSSIRLQATGVMRCGG